VADWKNDLQILKKDKNDQNYKKQSTPGVSKKPNGKSQFNLRFWFWNLALYGVGRIGARPINQRTEEQFYEYSESWPKTSAACACWQPIRLVAAGGFADRSDAAARG
jgi:hypothetical protein